MANVKVYSTPTCPYCKIAKEFLKTNNVEFENIDVSKSKEDADHMVHISGQMGVPVIDIDGTIIVGADKEAIKKKLNLK